MLFFFFGAFCFMWLGGSWFLMWNVGAFHAWFDFIPTMSYTEALEISFVPSVIALVLYSIAGFLKS